MPRISFNKETNGCGIQFTEKERKELEEVKKYLGFESIEEVIEDALTCYLGTAKNIAEIEGNLRRRGDI